MKCRFRNAPLGICRLVFVHGINDKSGDAHDKIDDEKGRMELVQPE